MGNELGRLLTLDEVADRLRTTVWTVRRWASQRKIPTVRVVGRVLVAEAELDRWLSGKLEAARNGNETKPL